MSSRERDGGTDVNRSMRSAALWICGGGIVVALFVALVLCSLT